MSCLVVARPTKSLVLHLQILGRGLRTNPGKEDCLILDHAGNTERHGFADDDREWSLLHGVVKPEPVRRKLSDIRNITCKRCDHIYAPQPQCPKCGYKFETKGKGIAFVDGELLELTPSRSAPTHEERKIFYQQLKGYAAIKGYKRGWAIFKYKEKFKEEPLREWNNLPEMLPGETIKRWIKSRLIAFHKARNG